MRSLRGHSPEKRIRECAVLKTIFSCLLCYSQDLPVEAQVCSQDLNLKEYCNILPPESNIFRKYDNFLAPEAQNLAASSIKKLENFVKIGSQAPVLCENPLTRPHFHDNLSAHKPSSSEIRAAHTFQKIVKFKTECFFLS